MLLLTTGCGTPGIFRHPCQFQANWPLLLLLLLLPAQAPAFLPAHKQRLAAQCGLRASCSSTLVSSHTLLRKFLCVV